jgi:hypothetical protein
MLGRKVNTISDTLAKRVRVISEAPPSALAQQAASAAKRAPRALAYRPGTLTFVGGERVDVVVTNLSTTGARIQFKRGTPLPERVCLTQGRTGSQQWAYVTWQTWGVAGLQFVGAKRAS